MNTNSYLQALSNLTLRSLVKGFVLTKQTEGKSLRTVEYHRENLRRFLWYTERNDWPNDISLINEWHFREFLAYVGSEKNRWGLEGNGSETSRPQATLATVHQ